MEMWCDEHSKMVREFGFEEQRPTRWCPQGGERCRLTWRNVETVDFLGARN